MSTTIHRIVFSREGNENATTRMSPVAPYDPAAHTPAFLAKQSTHCVSSDNDMLVSCLTFEIKDVTLPAWLPPDEWCRSSTRWAYVFAVADKSWPEHWLRGLARIEGTAQRLACARLLGTRSFRSSFRASLRAQLDAWIAGDNEYDTPFSWKQWNALVDRHTRIDAERIDRNTYYRGVAA